MEVTASPKTPIHGGISIILFSLAFLGNIATLIILYRNRAFRNVSQARLFLANIAFIDLINSLSCLFSGIGYKSGESVIKDKTLCKLEAYRRFTAHNMSLLSVTLLAINRYYVMVRRRQSQQIFTKRRSILYIFVQWLSNSAIGFLARIVQPEKAGYLIEQSACSAVLGSKLLPVIFFGILCPCVVLVFYSYTNIYKYFKAQTRQANVLNLAAQENIHREDVKLAKILFVILFWFAITYIFNMSFYIYYVVKGKVRSLSWVRVSVLVTFSNYVVNIVIYGLMDIEYRRELISLFCRCGKRFVEAVL